MFATAPEQPTTLSIEQQKEDITVCMELLTRNKQNAEQLSRRLQEFQQECHQKEFSKGIDFYDSKNLLLLQYLTELQFYVLFRLEGKDLTSGQGFNLYKNLLYLKTLLMKLGPIERKLEYKVNKILKEANQQLQVTTTPSRPAVAPAKEEDVRKYKPHPQNLTRQRTTDNDMTAAGDKKYVAPKLTSTLMQKDEKRKRQSLREERRKAHLRRQLRDVFADGEQPEDLNTMSVYEQRLAKQQKERVQYEEANFTRLPETKKDRRQLKHAQKKVTQEDVGDLTELDKMRELLQYERLIEQDYEKEEKLNKTLGIRKKIKKY